MFLFSNIYLFQSVNMSDIICLNLYWPGQENVSKWSWCNKEIEGMWKSCYETEIWRSYFCTRIREASNSWIHRFPFNRYYFEYVMLISSFYHFFFLSKSPSPYGQFFVVFDYLMIQSCHVITFCMFWICASIL